MKQNQILLFFPLVILSLVGILTTTACIPDDPKADPVRFPNEFVRIPEITIACSMAAGQPCSGIAGGDVYVRIYYAMEKCHQSMTTDSTNAVLYSVGGGNITFTDCAGGICSKRFWAFFDKTKAEINTMLVGVYPLCVFFLVDPNTISSNDDIYFNPRNASFVNYDYTVTLGYDKPSESTDGPTVSTFTDAASSK